MTVAHDGQSFVIYSTILDQEQADPTGESAEEDPIKAFARESHTFAEGERD